VAKKGSLVADWFTGTHDRAAAIAAVSYQPRPDLLIITGWKAAMMLVLTCKSLVISGVLMVTRADHCSQRLTPNRDGKEADWDLRNSALDVYYIFGRKKTH